MRLLVFHRFLFLCIFIFIGLPPVQARNRDRNSRESSDENKNSLLDLGDDNDEITSTTAEPVTQLKNGDGLKSQAKEAKKKSRKITLPDDYNKLEIPKPSLKIFVKDMMGEEFENLSPEALAELEGKSANFLPPLLIAVDVKVRSIRDIDEINEELTVELDFIVQWIDSVILFEQEGNDAEAIITGRNLSVGLKSLDPVFLRDIWKPDIFIENVISISRPELISKPVRLLFSPAGYFVFATRVTVKIDCEMEFHFYPADTQSCVFRLRSYSHTIKDINITWQEPGGPFLLDRSEHNFDVKLDMMETLNETEAEGLIDDGYNETYAVLQFKISARRKLSYHLIQTYLPSTFFIIITWLSFLVPATMVEARIGISMTTLLTLTSMFSAVRENTPIVSYVKAIDYWMVACIFFVFLTLLEFTLLTWRRHLKPKKIFIHDDGEQSESNGKRYSPVETQDKVENIELQEVGADSTRERRALSPVDKYLKRFKEEDIEKYGFRAFSLLFLIYNAIYWPWLLVSSDYFKWDIDFTYNSKD